MTTTTAIASSVASTQSRAWMRLPSGAHLDLIDPNPLAWHDSDLATRLARTYRWGGESAWPLPQSVAEHCLLVLQLRRQTSPVPLTVDDELLELLHDAEEGFLGFDCIAPLKPVLGPGFKAVADRLMQSVCESLQRRIRAHSGPTRRAGAISTNSRGATCRCRLVVWVSHTASPTPKLAPRLRAARTHPQAR